MKRKWFIAVIILAIIAVVLTIVFINLFKEKDTLELAKNVNNTVQNGYLNDEKEEYQTIQNYLQSVESKLTTSEEKAEVQNYRQSYQAFVVIGEFFDRQIVFSDYTNIYKSNKKAIANNFKKGQSAANAMEKYINETKDLVGGSDYWEANTWTNCKDIMKNLFTYTSNAFTGLQKVYQASVTSKIMNNDLTDIIFMGVTDLMDDIKENLTTNRECGYQLYRFSNSYLAKSSENTILTYIYANEQVQNKVKDIKEKGSESDYYNQLLDGSIV